MFSVNKTNKQTHFYLQSKLSNLSSPSSVPSKFAKYLWHSLSDWNDTSIEAELLKTNLFWLVFSNVNKAV